MPYTAIIQLTVAGTNTGPFDLYSDADNYFSPFETGISRASILAGYVSVLVPNNTTVIKVQSLGECNNYININVDGLLPTPVP